MNDAPADPLAPPAAPDPLPAPRTPEEVPGPLEASPAPDPPAAPTAAEEVPGPLEASPAADPLPAPRTPEEVPGPLEASPAPDPPAAPTAAAVDPRQGPLGRVRAWIKARNDATQARWDAVLEIPPIKRTRFLAKVVAIHVRYASGYLMAGFLVSAPIQLVRAHEGPDPIFKSIALGLLFLIPFVVLIPFTRMAWENMRLPEFKNLELGLTLWASIGCAAFLVLTWIVQLAAPADGAARWLFDPHIAWVNLGLMIFAWLRVRFDAWLFKEFYTLHPGDESLVLFRPPRAAPPANKATEAIKATEATPATPAPAQSD